MGKILCTSLLILGILLILLLILWLAVPNMIFSYIFSVPKRSKKIPKYYIGTPHYNVSQAGLKLMKKLKSEDAYINSRDGLKLHAYLFPVEEKNLKKFVIGIHGYRSYSRPEYAPYIEFYRSRGYSMLLPDDRAHRPSEGEYIGFGVLDRLDCVDWAKYLVHSYGEDTEILLHGVSMGGATVCAAAGEDELPKQVRGIISDCAFTSGRDELRYQLREMAHLPADKLLPKVERVCEAKAGFNLHSNTALQQVKKARVPMLFVQGGKDVLVPPKMAEELYEACGSAEKRLLMVPEAGHGESIAFAPDEYHRLIEELFMS
ncbi:MAG: alpha/beta hydrolase [Candidatus Limivicinus sp.]|jgi:fermentation-respiration switch protein FrsA (DUF1100 family)